MNDRGYPYNDDGLALVCLGGVLVGGGRNDLGQADSYSKLVCWFSRVLRSRLTWAVGLGLQEPAEDGLVERGVGTALKIVSPISFSHL